MFYGILCALAAALFMLGALTAVCGALYLLCRPKRKETTFAVIRITQAEKNAVARISFLLTFSALFARPHTVLVIAVCAPGAEAAGERLRASFPRTDRLLVCGEHELADAVRDHSAEQ